MIETKKILTFFLIFGSLFLGVLELFGCLLGGLLGSLEAFLGGLKTQKLKKTYGFLRFLKMQLFGL